MEDGRWRKRRRLDQPEITKTTPNESDALACAIGEGDLGFYGASNIHSNGVASEAALTDTGDSGRATLVCYGMLENLPIVSIPTAVIIDNPTLDSAYLDENGMVQRSSDGACVGKLEDKALQCLSKLHNEDIKTQFMLKTVERHSYRKRVVRPVALASVIIYGPGDMGDDVGDFLDRHQKQALWFFLTRERPSNPKHIWQTRTLTDGSLRYVNEITGSYQNKPPPAWNGGILADEMGLAHIIRNKTSTSFAISALKAVSRWAITGTPIQNSFADVGGLLRFLRFPPYDDGKSFDKDIIDFFRKENIEEGARRLKALCRPIMIRRPMSVVVLPTRQDLIKTVEFSAKERREYLKIENSLQEPSNDVASYSSEAHLSMITIQLINKLRLYCNLGACSTTTTLTMSQQTVVTTPESQGPIETLASSEVALGGTDCEECHQIIDIPDIPSNADISPYAYSCECCKLYCSVCAALGDNQTTKGFSSCKKSVCVLRPLFPGMIQKARNDQLPPDLYHAETSKIRALVQGVLSCLPEKSVVFSFWTSSLTVAQKALTAAGVRCVRIDGSVPPLQRGQTIQEFQADEEIKVILVTISCGGVGQVSFPTENTMSRTNKNQARSNGGISGPSSRTPVEPCR
ncbi:hypothetical protein EKO27_g12 [Xylaria grammica]|uniref:Uncharacterized protein n=1 Tax=Xylaria grammica TaxID=363999 RepID=A0A439DKX8_9PEZI|nr:hypothetical protein EKO27_g12 [Xylaria grammica]